MSKFMKTHPPVLKLLYADRRTWSSNTSVLATFQCKCAETRINLYWYHHGENFWIDFYDRMTVHCSRFLGNKTNRCTEFQFYWYYDSTCFGQPFCPSSGVLSRTSALVQFMLLWWPFATKSRMELQFHPAPGSKRSSQLHKMYQSRCMAKHSWWWAEGCPKHVES